MNIELKGRKTGQGRRACEHGQYTKIEKQKNRLRNLAQMEDHQPLSIFHSPSSAQLEDTIVNSSVNT
jgi:hypothetical protein